MREKPRGSQSAPQKLDIVMYTIGYTTQLENGSFFYPKGRYSLLTYNNKEQLIAEIRTRSHM